MLKSIKHSSLHSLELKNMHKRGAAVQGIQWPKSLPTGIVVRTGGKWRTQEAVEQAKSRLRHSVLIAPVASGQAGLGRAPSTRYDRALGKDRCRLVQEEVRAGVEELRASHVVGMEEQGTWTRWEQATQQDLLVQALASWALPDQVPECICLWRLTQPIQPLLLGQGWHTIMSFVPQKRDSRVYPQLLPKSPWRRALNLEPWAGAEDNSRNHLHQHHPEQASLTSKASYCFHQSRGEA